MANGQPFCAETVTLPIPAQGQDSAPSTPFIFHSYNFTLELGDWLSSAGVRLYGAVTEPNGTLDMFATGEPLLLSAASGWITYLAPDLSYGVKWHWSVSDTVILLVSA